MNVPSISSINRILRTESENKTLDWSMTSSTNSSLASSDCNNKMNNYSSNLIYPQTINRPTSSNEYAKKRPKFTSYTIEEILRKDDDGAFKSNQVSNTSLNTSKVKSNESEASVSTYACNKNDANLCYSYYYQAFLAAHYNYNQLIHLNKNQNSSSN